MQIIFVALFMAGLSAQTTPVFAQKKIKGRVTPMPAPTKPDSQNRMYAASEVPDPLENYTLTVHGEIDGTVFYPAAVPLFYLSDYRSSAGTIPVGTEFKAEFIRGLEGRHYYGMSEPESKEKNLFKPKSIKWIDGRFLKINKK